jgi:hypothetical protein
MPVPAAGTSADPAATSVPWALPAGAAVLALLGLVVAGLLVARRARAGGRVTRPRRAPGA